MGFKFRRYFTIFQLTLFLLIGVTGSAANNGLVKHKLVRLSRILELPNPDRRSARLVAELRQTFDYTCFENKILADAKTSLSKPQQLRFSKAFQQMFERKLLAMADDESLRCAGYTVTKGERDTEVIVACSDKAEPNSLTLHFTTGANAQVCDITVAGALLSRNYRGVINKTLRKEGADGLLQKLESKSATSLTAKSLL